MIDLIFFVAGTPVTQGSMRAITRKDGRVVVMHNANAKLKAWRKDVGEAARAMIGSAAPIAAAHIEIELLFLLERPRTVKERERPHVAPDIDKYLRAVLDALEGIVYRNDGQVTDVVVKKRYAEDDGTGVQIILRLPDA